MDIRKTIAISMLFVVFVFTATKAYALGDGPRVYWAVPEGTNVLTPMLIGIDSNFGFDHSLVVPDAQFDTDIQLLMYTRAVSFGGNLGGLSIIVPGVQVDGGVSNTGFQGSSSGLGDIVVMATISLFGALAYAPEDFSSYQPETILDLLFAVTAPTGEYDSDKLINISSNRWSLRFGMPFMHFFSSGPGHTTSLELQPSATFFTDNNDAPGASSQLKQDVIYSLEGHLTRDFNRMFWGSLDALYTVGGETTVDGVDKNNAQRSLGVGATLGVNLSKKVGISASYGTVVERNDSSQDGEMFRMTLKYLF